MLDRALSGLRWLDRPRLVFSLLGGRLRRLDRPRLLLGLRVRRLDRADLLLRLLLRPLRRLDRTRLLVGVPSRRLGLLAKRTHRVPPLSAASVSPMRNRSQARRSPTDDCRRNARARTARTTWPLASKSRSASVTVRANEVESSAYR